MYIRFKIFFASSYGQELAINIKHITTDGKIITREASMEFDPDGWTYTFEFSGKDNSGHVEYVYQLMEDGQYIRSDGWKNRKIQLDAQLDKNISIIDTWQDKPFEQKVFDSKAFANVLLKKYTHYKTPVSKQPTHHIRVQIPPLPKGKLLCMTGSGHFLGNWNPEKPILLGNEQDLWAVKLNLSKETFPIEYKFATYDLVQKKLEHFEEGPNRVLTDLPASDEIFWMHHYADIKKHAWKGAGVNVQVSSLRSNDSWGVGDFKDIEQLIKWSKITGLKMIQLLPINDTTAYHDQRDSYPYSAVSAYALHPIFLNIEAIARKQRISLPSALKREANELNNKPTLDYTAVLNLKLKAIATLFTSSFPTFELKEDYQEFFTQHASWLKPYAAFCYLRDKYQTADHSQWGKAAFYSEDLLNQLTNPSAEHYADIAIHYYMQFHLHNQLNQAVEKAHKSGIILKGDLPIGVGRFSVETWMHPQLFHMEMQAGAPPDAFTRKGQNWSFPTYNWESMKKDGYHWWRQRLWHMSRYFDATRIDHVLGFFRIWSIPLHAVEGIFGIFDPINSIPRSEFEERGLQLSIDRLTKPYITDSILTDLFANHKDWVKTHVLKEYSFNPSLSTQVALDKYFGNDQQYLQVRQGLFDLLANVILFTDRRAVNHYHFRISIHETSSFQALSDSAKQILNDLYIDYFFRRQDSLWYHTAQTKFDAIQDGTDMMLCAEDLGMVPDMVEGVLQHREMLALQVQRMPKRSHQQFSHPTDAPYLSVVTPSTHDMSTIREWWEENREVTQLFYNQQLSNPGTAPEFAETWVCKSIIDQHVKSPAMWAVFLLQDLMSMDEATRRIFPAEDRINIPANPNHYWNYRMHISLETLNECKSLANTILNLIDTSGRG